MTIQERLQHGLFLEATPGHESAFEIAAGALCGLRDEHLSVREQHLLEWGITFGAAFGMVRQEDPWEATHSVARRALEPARMAWLTYEGLMPSRTASMEEATAST